MTNFWEQVEIFVAIFWGVTSNFDNLYGVFF